MLEVDVDDNGETIPERKVQGGPINNRQEGPSFGLGPH
jgi:hypothetical protein